MRNGRLTPGELKRSLKIDREEYKKYIEAGLPKDADDSGIITHDLNECVAWLDENTIGFGSGSKVEIKTLEDSNVIKAFRKPVRQDYTVDTVMINDCECIVKTKHNISTVQVVIEVDVPEDEVQDFAESLTNTIYEYQEEAI